MGAVRSADPETVGPAFPRPGVLLAAAAGGVLGALARWSAGRVWPTATESFPWTTLAVNLTGCLLVGVVAGVLYAGTRTGRATLVRPFVVTGILGGYTTFSTWSVDVDRLVGAGHLLAAATDLVVTLTGAVGAVAVGVALARRVTREPTRATADPSVHR